MNRTPKLSSLVVRKRTEKGVYHRDLKNKKINFLQSNNSEKRYFPFDYLLKDTKLELQSKTENHIQDSTGPFISLYKEIFVSYKNRDQFFTPQEVLAQGPFNIFSGKEISFLCRKKILFIDLDETLVHCSYLKEEEIEDKEDPSVIKIENKNRTYYVRKIPIFNLQRLNTSLGLKSNFSSQKFQKFINWSFLLPPGRSMGMSLRTSSTLKRPSLPKDCSGNTVCLLTPM